jgi:Tfp pilus assembly protein PilO
VKEKEVERNNQEEHFNHLNKLSEELKEYEEELSKIDSAFPLDPDVPDLLNFLVLASSQNGLSFGKVNSFSADSAKKSKTAVSGQEGVPTKRYKELTIDFDVSGEYPSLKNFVSTLEKSARMIEIDSISLKQNLGQLKEESLPIYNFKIKTYY